MPAGKQNTSKILIPPARQLATISYSLHQSRLSDSEANLPIWSLLSFINSKKNDIKHSPSVQTTLDRNHLEFVPSSTTKRPHHIHNKDHPQPSGRGRNWPTHDHRNNSACLKTSQSNNDQRFQSQSLPPRKRRVRWLPRISIPHVSDVNRQDLARRGYIVYCV